mmetsp:Transcript_35901/g.69733  ORF Transcript_35901/g.69733 Transcript_35901/m.69733 type:complete len:361 (-) Transcript_35901:199-1281(-)
MQHLGIPSSSSSSRNSKNSKYKTPRKGDLKDGKSTATPGKRDKIMALVSAVREKRNLNISYDSTGKYRGMKIVEKALERLPGQPGSATPDQGERLTMLDEGAWDEITKASTRIDVSDTTDCWWSELAEDERVIRARMADFLSLMQFTPFSKIIVVGHSQFFREIFKRNLSTEYKTKNPQIASDLTKDVLSNCSVMQMTMEFSVPSISDYKMPTQMRMSSLMTEATHLEEATTSSMASNVGSRKVSSTTTAPVVTEVRLLFGSKFAGKNKGGLHGNKKAVQIGQGKTDHWQKDEDVKKCPRCEKTFGIGLRKHHCRQCGRIFCNACSSQKLKVLEYGFTTPERVCDRCYGQLTGSTLLHMY